jgi:hypothetical protein
MFLIFFSTLFYSTLLHSFHCIVFFHLTLVLLINAYTLSSTKLEIRAKQFLLGSEGVGERGRGWGEREGTGGRG